MRIRQSEWAKYLAEYESYKRGKQHGFKLKSCKKCLKKKCLHFCKGEKLTFERIDDILVKRDRRVHPERYLHPTRKRGRVENGTLAKYRKRSSVDL